MTRAVRPAAAAIAIIAWVGLAVQLRASLALAGTLAPTLWVMLRYFTVLANLCVAILFSRIALRPAPLPSATIQGGVTIAILLVGVVYGLLLRGLLDLSGGAWLANLLLHVVTPILVPIYWLILTPKGGLRWRDPLYWSIAPLVYFGYALARGASEGIYAYPFMNVARLGWPQTLVNALAVAIGFIATGYLLVLIDRRLAPAAIKPASA